MSEQNISSTYLAGTRVNLVDTTNTDNESELGLVRNVDVSVLSGVALQLQGITFGLAVLLHVFLSTLEDLGLGLLSLLQNKGILASKTFL